MKSSVLIIATVLALGGCGGGDDKQADAPSTSAKPPVASPSAPGPAPSADGRLEKVGATALKPIANGTLTSIETEGPGWEVQVISPDGTEHETTVDAAGDRITRTVPKQEGQADRDEHQRRIKAAKLDYRKAAEAMRSAVPGARITELNLDTYRGATVWEGDLIASNGTKHEVKIDAGSGKVLAK
ncbi:PepSY domain-containing protein [Spirillospora sp. CA-294931]|uniref:PepSY domain-containing protein n=1 Tax=Spirillospora sp. CA-294931 TaxID=3240042 RepID=UPI003D933540